MQNICEVLISRYKEEMGWWRVLSNPIDKISHE
jgi:hypothetical protein